MELQSPTSPTPAAPGSPLGPFIDGPMSGLLFSNAVTFVGAVFQHWPAWPVMVIYWGQSVAIGIANVIRISMLKDFSTAGLTSGGRPVPETPAAKRSTARFFALHYGGFHLVYALFLFRTGHPRVDRNTAIALAANVALFAGSHVWHVIAAHGSDYRGKPNLGTLLFYPYLRVLPMHLAIILGSAFPSGALPLFIVLKTGADLGMHAVERFAFRVTPSAADSEDSHPAAAA